MPLCCNCMFELCQYSPASLMSVRLSRHLPFSNQQVQIQEMVLRLYLRLCKMKKNRSHDCGGELKSRLVTRFPSKKPQSTISQLHMSSKKALKSFSFTMNGVSCCDPAE